MARSRRHPPGPADGSASIPPPQPICTGLASVVANVASTFCGLGVYVDRELDGGAELALLETPPARA